MRSICLALSLAFAAPAFADVQTEGSAPDASRTPLSVWRPDDAGGLTHLQSGLACPAQFRGYQRTDAHLYNPFGLDVSCNYLAPQSSDLTVYLTHRTGTTVDDAITEARREFVEVRAAMHPRQISETHPDDGDLAWDLTLYADDGGARDAIWIADLGGWTLEYRVTYRGDAEARVMEDVAAFTDLVVQSAGAELGRCAKSSPPPRAGALITDKSVLSGAAVASAVMGSVGIIQAQQSGAVARPIFWCAEQPVSGGAAPVLLWRGVYADGADAGADQITAMTLGEPPAMTVDANPAAGHPGAQPRWMAHMVDGDMVRIYGYFTDRPTPDALSALFLDVITGKATPLTSYGVKNKTITIGTPPAAK